MQFNQRFGLAVAAITLAGLSPAFSVQAQTLTPTPAPITFQTLTCTLSAADCKLVATAEANLAQETSFQQAFNFKMSIAGNNPITVQSAGTGAFSIDPKVNIYDQPALVKAVQFQLTFTGSSIAGSSRQAGKVGLILKDGIEYGQSTSNNAAPGNWTGVDLATYLATIRQNQSTGNQSATNQAVQQALQQFLSDPDVRAALAAIPNTKGYITQQRLPADAFLEGQRMAQIQYTYNFQALFASPDFARVFSRLFKAIVAAYPPDTPGLQGLQQINRMNETQIQGMLMLFGGVLGKTNLTYVRWIGETDKLTHALNFVINLNLDPSALSPGNAAAANSAINGTISLSVQVTKIGKPVTVTAPKNATIITQQQLQQGLGLNNGINQ